MGVRVTKGGYQILLGDCDTITVSSGSSSIDKIEGRILKQSKLEVRYSPTDGLLPILVAPRPSTLYLPHSIARRKKIRQFQLSAEPKRRR